MIAMMALAFISLVVWWIQRLCSRQSKNSIYPVDSGSENRELSSEDEGEQNKQLEVEEMDMNESDLNLQNKQPEVIALDKKPGVKRYKRFRQEI